MLAGELALAGVDVAIVERRINQELAGSRAGGLHSRTIEIFDMRGIADRFLSEGQVAQVAGFGGTRLDISDFPTRHPYGLGLWQNHIERIMAGWIDELPVTFYRGREVRGFTQDDAGVDVELADGQSLRAEYLVGCDGGRSVVRKAAGIEFPGWDPTTSNILAQVEMTEKPPLGIHRTALGMYSFGRLEYEIQGGVIVYKDVGPIGVMVPEADVGRATEPTLRDLSEALRETVSELLSMDEPRKRFAAMMSGLGIHYDLGEGHPLLGRRVPDLDLVTASGPVRVFTLLHDARPVLLNLGEPGRFDITPWADRVQLIDGTYDGTWELPAIGAVSAPVAVLIRPDGYVAWVGDLTQVGLTEALTTWFGPPVTA